VLESLGRLGLEQVFQEGLRDWENSTSDTFLSL
jgi:hypothetical protein